jgi:cytochrome c nitrite reductase small subunit
MVMGLLLLRIMDAKVSSKIPLYLGIAAASLLGVLAGLGSYTFHYGQGASYFSTESAVCANCHIMQPHYDSWTKSSHSAVAGCADCHLPADFPHNLISKADNGWNHSWAFTMENFHEPIQIKPRNARILENNCVRCHDRLVHSLLAAHEPANRRDKVSCIHCHVTVGHGPPR